MGFKAINECKVARWEIYLPCDPQNFFAGSVDDDDDDDDDDNNDDCNDDFDHINDGMMTMIPCNVAQTILRGCMKN